MVVLSTRVSYTTQLSGSTFHSGELYNTTEWWYFHSGELYNTTELTHELSDVWNVLKVYLDAFRFFFKRGHIQMLGNCVWLSGCMHIEERLLNEVPRLRLEQKYENKMTQKSSVPPETEKMLGGFSYGELTARTRLLWAVLPFLALPVTLGHITACRCSPALTFSAAIHFAINRSASYCCTVVMVMVMTSLSPIGLFFFRNLLHIFRKCWDFLWVFIYVFSVPYIGLADHGISFLCLEE